MARKTQAEQEAYEAGWNAAMEFVARHLTEMQTAIGELSVENLEVSLNAWTWTGNQGAR